MSDDKTNQDKAKGQTKVEPVDNKPQSENQSETVSGPKTDIKPDTKSGSKAEAKAEKKAEKEAKPNSEPKTQQPVKAEAAKSKVETTQMPKPKTEANNDAQSRESQKEQKSVAKEPVFDAPKMPKLGKPQKARSNKGMLWFVLILLVIATGGIGWSTYQQYLMEQNWQSLRSDLVEQSAGQSQNVSLAKEDAQQSLKVSSDNSRLVMQQTQLINQLKDALTATQERVRELSGRQQQDWLLAEAEYLIKLAEYKITLEKDKTTAIGLLKTADQRVMEIADNSLLELRQIIAQDVGNLQLVVAPDVGGISSQLIATSKQIEALDLKALSLEEIEPKKKESQTESEEFSWRDVYQDFLNDFVTTHHHDEPRRPLMTPEQRGNLNANIQLALQKAQIALVRSEQELYENSINEALTWVETFFVANEVSETVINNLKSLAMQRVMIDLPNSLDSKNAIQAINQQRLYQWLNQQNSNVSETDSEQGEVL